jgi:galactokinase
MFRQHVSGLPPELAKRSRFIIEESERVRALAEAFARDDRAAIRDLASASFAGARDLFEISVPAMESMFEAMRIAPGCIGCRQAGAGFGGCMIAVVDDGLVEAFCREAAAAYLADTGIVPEIYPIRAAAGAGALRLA